MTKRILFGVIAAVFFVSFFAGAHLARAQEDPAAGEMMRDTNPFERKKPYVPLTTAPTELDLVAVGTIKEILKTTLIRFEDGKVYSLINLRVPVVYEGKALEYMREHYIGKKVGVYQRNWPGVMLNDKYGNVAGHMVSENNEWIQADIVLQGLAWVDSTPRNRDLVTKLYSYETIARNQKKGFWAAPSLAVKNAETILDKSIDSFQVVEDVVKKAKSIRDTFYFNFGDNAAKDFTVIMDHDLGSFFFVDDTNHAISLSNWNGHRIRVRGWVTESSGPMIRVTHPEQIEFAGMESELRYKSPTR